MLAEMIPSKIGNKITYDHRELLIKLLAVTKIFAVRVISQL